MSQQTDAVRETIAEWMRHQAGRIESGEYLQDLEDGKGPARELTDGEVRELNVLLAAVKLASDGELGHGDRTPLEVRGLLKVVLEYAESAVNRIEGAHPASGMDLLNARGEILSQLREKADKKGRKAAQQRG